MLTESLLLAVAGGLAGLAVAKATLGLLVARLPASVPRAADVGMDARIFGFALAAALLCGLLCGLVPALRLSSGDLLADLRQGGSGATPSRGWWYRGLVAVEIALSLALAVGAGLTLKSLWRLQRVDLGFAPQRLLTFQPLPTPSRYPGAPERLAYFQQVSERIAALPGVESVAAAFPLPLTGEQVAMAYEVEGRLRDSQEQPPYAEYTAVTPTYFHTLGIRLVEGRAFTEQDRAGSEEVAIVNQTLAHRLWPNESAVGKRLRWLGNPWLQIVGVAANVKQSGLTTGSGDLIYRPWAQDAWLPSLYLAVRTERRAETSIPEVRKAVWSVDPQAPITALQTMEERVAANEGDARFITLLLSLGALVAIGLGVIGVYGVTALVVGRRRRELGIRLALGASRGSILGQALGREAIAVAIGLAVGLGLAWSLGRVLSSLLFGVSPRDPLIFVVTSLLLVVAAGAAVLIPARRAARSDFQHLLRAT
jgi:putative ABC transport system permease protein